MNKYILVLVLFLAVKTNAQVNLQTGAAEISFPLFQFSDGKSRLSTGVSLNYISGNGIKVNDVATGVGTGWGLSVGGVITRLQQGEPDDQLFIDNTGSGISFREKTASGLGMDKHYSDGYMHSTVSPLDPIPMEASYTPYFPANTVNPFFKGNYDDREQDIYFFQFNGRSGQFVIGKDKKPLILDDTKLKVCLQEANMTNDFIRTTIASFTITDEAGIQYKFSEREISEVLKYDETGIINGYRVLTQVELIGALTLRKVVSKWFLAEIVNPFTNEKIIFNYEDLPIDMQGTKHVLYQTITGETDSEKEVSIARTKMTTKRLVSITCPDSHSLTFNYSSTERVDLPGDKALTGISVLYNNVLLYAYEFNYAYFFKFEIKPFNFSFQPQDKRYARLCLTDFKTIGPDGIGLPPHVFTYIGPNSGGYNDIYPPAFSLFGDHWGYFNPQTFYMTEDANGYPSANNMLPKYHIHENVATLRYCLIQEVKYPEGGTLTFDYDINKSELSPYQGKYAGGLCVTQTKLFDGNSHSNDIVRQYRYVNADPSATSSSWGYETPDYTETKIVKHYKNAGGISAGLNASTVVTDFVRVVNQNLNLRPSESLRDRHKVYSNYKSAITAMALKILIDIIVYIFSPDHKDYTINIVKNDNGNFINPLPFQYSRVEVVEPANNSKIVYEFTNPSTGQEYALRVPGPYTEPYSSKQRFAHWIYGLPRFITYLKSDGITPVKKIENIYNPIVREIQDNNFVSKSWTVNTMVSNMISQTPGPFSQSYITADNPFYPIQGRLELEKTIEYIYNGSGAYTTTETSYTYSPNNFMVRTISRKDSKGSYIGTTTYYVADYDITGVINNMKDLNMVNLPVSVNSWVKGPVVTDNEKLIASEVTEYNTVVGGDFRPYKLYQSEITAPVDNTVADVDNFSATNFKNYSYLKHQTTLLYSQGNPSQHVIISGNSNKSAIYDYNQRLVVAEAINAAQSTISYTSFEADGTGGWVYSPTGVKTTFSATGKKCFDLTTGNIGVTNWGIPEPLTISMWTTGNEIYISRSYIGSSSYVQITPSRTGPTINGWKYCEFTLDLAEIDDFYISGNGLIDELRMHPVNARMTTYCYEPGIGKTAECDATNRIIYYEYDKLGRLSAVRDQYRNLIKAYEYNYKQ
jgi:hypothetical protein